MRGLSIFALVVGVIAGFVWLVWSNAAPLDDLRPVVPTQVDATPVADSWQDILRAGLNFDGTLVPTVAIPDRQYVPPTLAVDDQPTPTLVQAGDLSAVRPADVFVIGVTPTPPPPTLDARSGDSSIPARDVATPRPLPTNPPALEVPLVRHPNDHFFFIRPIDSNRQNFGLRYYAYGTNGPRDNPLRVHHGIDMPNPVGTTIRAAGSGRVVFASTEENPTFQNTLSYGNVVVIEHDFGYRGQMLWTLYAHIEVALVTLGQRVEAGDPIALVGNTGLSSGAHLHFEVRMGSNDYGSTYNPVLWMAPYVNHGVIAGQVVDARGNFIDDVDITLSRAGFTRDTTTSYVFREVGSRVNSDPNWQENFVFADVPVGRYTVEATINGQRVTRVVDVREGMTTAVRLEPPQPVEAAPTPGDAGT